jgi:hypothetical protein
VIVVPFMVEHLTEIREQPGQAKDLSVYADPRFAQDLATGGEAFTVFEDGEILACLGVFQFWPGRGLCWAVLSSDLRRHMVVLSKRIRAYFDQCGYARLEATIDPNFEAAIRWATALGFTCETPDGMKKYTPSGATQLLYSRVRND